MYQLALGPALVIVLVVAVALALRFPLKKKAVGSFLSIFGLGSMVVTLFLAFLWGFFLGLAILGAGIALRSVGINSRRIKRSLYVCFACVIIACSLLITIRLTGVVHEEWLETYNVNFFGDAPNVVVRGSVISAAYNYEVNTGYSYHIFPACVSLHVTEVIWSNSSSPMGNFNSYVLEQKELIVYYEKPDAPALTAGQIVEVKGIYCPGLEDSLYIDVLVVSPLINGSYLNSL
jgi:hypothetical protein